MEIHIHRTITVLLATILLMAGCGSDDDGIGENAMVSECGGFSASAGLRAMDSAAITSRDYCDAERLYWTYADGIVHFDNTRVMLNCCGIHTITVYAGGPGYIIRETDEPERNTRCSCMCAFDFSIELPIADPAPETVAVALSRDITDDELSRETVWSGELNLADGSGIEIVNDQPQVFCE